METCQLNRMGFITNYLVAGPKETDDTAKEQFCTQNQLKYEQHLRTVVADREVTLPEEEVRLGGESSLGLPWRYYYHYGNWFVDESTFYSTLQKVELDAITILDAAHKMQVRAVLWSYAAVDVWCNERHVGRIDAPVYKPIRREVMVLDLKGGPNQIYIKLQTLGVRDTRTLFGIQILDHVDEITVSLPDGEHTQELVEMEQWLGAMELNASVLTFASEAPAGAWLAYDSQSPDFAMIKSRKEWQDISGKKEICLDEGKPGVILIRVRTKYGDLTRKVENILAQKPVFSPSVDYEDNKKDILRRIGSAESLSRGDKFGFSISNILARKAMGMELEKDRDLLLETLDQIENRYDCSDFLVCGLVRYLKNYPLDKELEQRVKEVLLNWRYWMDQKGSDAMCFWSENHSLMFYICAMNVGEMYENDYFPRAGMTGRELADAGKKKVEYWLSDVEKHGFEEFLSTVYMCVTFAALLNTIDYSEPEISVRASKITDNLLHMLCRHAFDGSIIAPMGRVYREVVHPFEQGAQALMNLINPEVPYSFGEGWLGFYATSGYRLPQNLCDLMNGPADMNYTTGNALIHLLKTEEYCLTSVQSPRKDTGFQRWENLTLDSEADPSTCAYTKSLNERFHGTTCFEPGVYGYQQHLWYAALDKETAVFTNHPGGTCDSSSMRPGFWYGNGVMPAVAQDHQMLGAVYHIPDEYPIHFTHVYFPAAKFDQTVIQDQWLFGKKKSGYMAVWCSKGMEPADDQLFGCEYRTYGDDIAYVCLCGNEAEYKSLDEFIIQAKQISPFFDQNSRTLQAGKLRIGFTENHDKTQYI